MTGERDDRSDDLPETDLDDWYRHADGKQDGQTGGLGVQARDRKIRRLIEEVRRLRTSVVRPSPPSPSSR
jgi:hypothetical protein